MMMNITTSYLYLCSSLNSPLLTSTKSSASYSVSNCKFKRFFNCLYRSSSASLVKEHIQIKKSEISKFLATPFSLTPDYSGQLIEERIFIGPADDFASLTIVDCTFYNIISDEKGAAIRIAKQVPLALNDSIFTCCVSRNEAAILFVLIGKDTWSLQPININRCSFDRCYSTGQFFTIINNYTDKYPSVLIHDFLGFKQTSIETNINEITAVNCQENEVPKKRFGAYIHHHANTFSLSHFNCTNYDKIDSSQVFFTQSHKQASNVMYILASGQVGNSLIEIKDIQSPDQLTLQSIDIYNSTLLTEEPVAMDDEIIYVKSESGIIDFGGDYSGSVVFIYCHFFNIETDDKDTEPALAYSSNGRLPIFANCYSNVKSIADNRGFSFTTPSEPSSESATITPAMTTIELPSMTSNQPTASANEINVIQKRSNTKNIIVVSVSITVGIILTVSTLIVVRNYLSHNINLIDETDDSNLNNKDLREAINSNSNIIYDAEEPYVE